VWLTLKFLYEDDLEEFTERERIHKICGYYEPSKRRIIISLPCITDNLSELRHDKFIDTLAHELIHHCQYTGGPANICKKEPSRYDRELINEIIPYRLRPHEIEAYENQRRLGEELKKYLNNQAIETLLKRLLATLKGSIKIDINTLWYFSSMYPKPISDDNDECKLESIFSRELEDFKKSKLSKIIIEPKDSKEIDLYIVINNGVIIKNHIKEIVAPMQPILRRYLKNKPNIGNLLEISYDFLKDPLEDLEDQILSEEEITKDIEDICYSPSTINLITLVASLMLLSPRQPNEHFSQYINRVLSNIKIEDKNNLIEIRSSLKDGFYNHMGPTSIILCKNSSVEYYIDEKIVDINRLFKDWKNYISEVLKYLDRYVEFCKEIRPFIKELFKKEQSKKLRLILPNLEEYSLGGFWRGDKI